ncbi:hypothetical protein CPAST_c29040 [Clostridium pasteurianum DSM 525 = ATCC 6013]|uniref:Uncharacterized protein n=1 Tax=Clostridium pasteurianum DSM 525 = ATCC 6013 TaxID=1262449 RepID=A0A0H3JB05_CLOPA|nr:hypothetical protein [Clostridium pasteurianum]AJA48970.1 hypothetical protein CPAST_c29040 [Clostridium pasteurianum DSM 525 = ATCC 6013]AJA52958.1 hypothetical protein CLPA_c29040 [Clostridium pasteurianum DSM 525 = ATCC 6013]AOZ76177.1 hypothetical protein AQ983_14115 [Clostridium pasteurianum DSM 525 = ATCC 6013]AOZ79973.1 hypothetical protein AQ984_14110 [Clostridium pasteurianum]ELP60266.1 hypothetical protein F502_06502 [Clostridium pasteurianum DSM 525 = ATCC 6013]
MSKCKKHEDHVQVVVPSAPIGGVSGCACSLPLLVLLILIILQFSKKGSGKKIDKGILFIIALFYLSCANPCKGY